MIHNNNFYLVWSLDYRYFSLIKSFRFNFARIKFNSITDFKSLKQLKILIGDTQDFL